MDAPQSLDSLFPQKIFRIPDYQRGYAWQEEQLKAFWEDLVNLSDDRSHYTGVLTLKEIPAHDIKETDPEYWLVDDNSYRVYHIVDGQQRLTTFVVFIQAIVEYLSSLKENAGKKPSEVFLTESLSVGSVCEKYLFKVKPTGTKFRTYKFGYTSDNPSDRYLRHRVLGEPGGGTIEETFYTLNLSRAKSYFLTQIEGLYILDGEEALAEVYKKLTKRFLFNQYIIRDEFDVFVAFETMNNRGKKLSDLELLKNRLIYLTTLYSEKELDLASQKHLRDSINDAWKEVYRQLGRDKSHPLNDDDFLRAHWTMFFKYSRQTGRDYIKFLLDEHFTPKRVHQKVAQTIVQEPVTELRTEDASEETENSDTADFTETSLSIGAALAPTDIREFVTSLKESAVYWFSTFHPHLAAGMSVEEQAWLDRLNRLGMAYFRPLVMAVLKTESVEAQRIKLFKRIERFIFIAFRLTTAKANYRSSEFYNAVRAVDRGEINIATLCDQLDKALAFTLHEDGTFRTAEFSTIMFKKFAEGGSGYYGWAGIRYFLYEYELSLLQQSRQKKVDWSDLLKSERDKVSIEHIYPQTETPEWAAPFAEIEPERRTNYQGSLGNLLLLSQSINSSLQNDSFSLKKNARFDDSGKKIRNGYSDGSHSEIEVAQVPAWDPEQVRLRGIKLLKFMEERWGLKIKDDIEREKLLFLTPEVAPA